VIEMDKKKEAVRSATFIVAVGTAAAIWGWSQYRLAVILIWGADLVNMYYTVFAVGVVIAGICLGLIVLVFMATPGKWLPEREKVLPQVRDWMLHGDDLEEMGIPAVKVEEPEDPRL
jgi:hypothetical protein